MFHSGAYESRQREDEENKTGTTLTLPGGAVKRGGAGAPGDTRARCSFIVAEGWRYGGGEPFCNAPVAAGSAYCVQHRRRCAPTPDSSSAALAEAAEAPPPPPEFGYLAEAVLPEALPDEAEEIRALLDVQPLDRGAAE